MSYPSLFRRVSSQSQQNLFEYIYKHEHSKKKIWFKSSTPFPLINTNIFPMFPQITYIVLLQEVRQHASLFLPLISEDQPPQIARPSFTVVTIFTIFAFFWEFPSPALPWQPFFGEPEVQISQRAWLQVWIFGSKLRLWVSHHYHDKQLFFLLCVFSVGCFAVTSFFKTSPSVTWASAS